MGQLLFTAIQGGILFYFLMLFIQHCFIWRPSDFTVSEDAWFGTRTVATFGSQTL
jgi:hypothetical protein